MTTIKHKPAGCCAMGLCGPEAAEAARAQAAEKTAVATEIARQIGGRAFFMMGTRHKYAADGGKALLFDIRGSKVANRIKVTLDASDTYTVRFFKVRGINIKTVKEISDVYNDMLRSVISETTGLALSLGPGIDNALDAIRGNNS